MIIHADMDAFYASVELLDKPELANKPVAVGGPSKSRGVVSAANYIARKFGVHSALATSIAMQRCPNLVLIKPNMGLYAEYSRKIHNVFSRYTPIIEPLALDEAFLDPSGSEKLFGNATSVGHRIKKDIENELGLRISIGIAKNKFVAKIASDIKKPNGFVIVEPAETQQFLDPLPISRIWGIGKKSAKKLHYYNIDTIEKLRKTPRTQLQAWFGNQAEHYYLLANGIDTRKVVSDHKAKSISHESTFTTDLKSMDELVPNLLHLTELVCIRLRNASILGKTITIKIKYSDFETISRSYTLKTATNETNAIWQSIKDSLLPKVSFKNKGVRLAGMGVSQLASKDNGEQLQLGLFRENQSNKKIDQLTDAINKRYGLETVFRATSKKYRPKTQD